MKVLFLVLCLTCMASVLSSCLPLAAGAAAGYVARDQGVRVRSPITTD
jgi:hypothetical protein